jgi:hypothetical protein
MGAEAHGGRDFAIVRQERFSVAKLIQHFLLEGGHIFP